MRTSLLFMLIASLATIFAAEPAPASPLYTLAKSVTLASPERWDLMAFDPASQRVYIAHGDRVSVVDGASGAVIGTVEGFPGGTHGVALVPALNKGYSDDGEAGTVSAFDLKTLKITASVKAEPDADAIVFEPKSGHIFVVDADPGKVTAIDPATDKAVATIDGGGKLETGIAGSAGKVYINGAEKREILRIDAATNAIDARWEVPSCTSPHGIAIDTLSHRLFTSCENNVLLVLDTEDGKLVATLPIGARTDGAAFDPVRKRVFSSNGDGTLTVIAENSPDSYAVIGTVQTMLGARTMTIDPKTGRLYLVSAEIKINEAAAPTDYRNRFQVTPGSTRLLIYDPAP